MCLLTGLLKCILGIVNGVILTIGILFMAVGGLLLWGMNWFLPKIVTFTDSIKSVLSSLGVQNTQSAIDSMMTTISANSAIFGAIIFSFGVLLSAISVLVYIALCCSSIKCLLIMIIVIISCLLVSMIVVTIVFGTNGQEKIFGYIENVMNDLIVNYQGDNGTDAKSIILNVIQFQVQCCGVYNYTDFNRSSQWWGHNVSSKLEFPHSCCKTENFHLVNLDNCTKETNSSNKDIGCYSKLRPDFKRFLSYVFISAGVSIAVLAILEALFILFLQCDSRVEK